MEQLHQERTAELRGTRPARVRMLAFLYTWQKERGRPTMLDVDVPEGGMTGRELAFGLGLPVEHIEGLFLNSTISGLDSVVSPGDRVAFVPHGTPASYPSFFGSFEAAALRS